MTWLYLPPDVITHAQKQQACLGSHSVQEQEDLTLDCTLQLADIKLWVTSSGKPMQRPLSWQGWKTRSWIKHLSGTRLKPLTASLGVDWWISSMAAIRANRFQLQAENLENKTQDIYGQTLPELLMRLNLNSAFLRMSADIYDWGSSKSMMTFAKWVTKLRQACLQRQKLVARIRGKDCLSWPTATATDATVNKARTPEKMIRKDGRNVLRTPSLAETVLQPENFPYTKKDLELAKQGKSYQSAKVYWPTATMSDASVGEIISPKDLYVETKSGNVRKITKTGESRSLGLARTVKMWPTPLVSSGNGTSQKEVLSGNPKCRLEVSAITWPTPRAMEPGSVSEGYGRGLKNTAENWRTPNASDAEGGLMEWQDGKAAKLKLRDHSVHAVKKMNCHYGHPLPMNMKNGQNLKMTLNPQFVEMLMGWPIGWSDCGSVVTGLSRWLQLMRLELFYLLQILNSENKEEQPCLI